MASAHDVAAELRRRLPDLPTKKLHKLLYYCQGHHLATFGKPLFSETISAWDMGPVVGQLWRQENLGERSILVTELDEGQLNTVGYVLSRYGALSGTDLEHLTHSERPWMHADRGRKPGTSAHMNLSVIAAYFTEAAADRTEPAVLAPDTSALTDWLAGAPERASREGRPDSPEELRVQLESHA